MQSTTRRSFIKWAASGALSLSAAPQIWTSERNPANASNRVRVGVIGIRSHGFAHIREFASLDAVEVAALCDVDESLFPERVSALEQVGKPKPKIHTDLRRLLDDKEIDAVSIVTPNHWHTLASLWAAQAGKHVTVEKPFSHTFFEGQKLVEAAQRYGRIIQHGTESRSNSAYQNGIDFLRQGGLGEVYMAKGICYKWRDTIGRAPDEPVPPGVHYDLWTGPAPKKPFSKNRFHYNWHWQWDYGNGDMGNQGVHEMDIARWGLGVTLPERITASGAHVMFDDDQETPNTLMAMFEFSGDQTRDGKKKILQFEVRHWITPFEGGLGAEGANSVGNIFYGSKGYMVMGDGGWKTFLGKKREPGPAESGRAAQIKHHQNFINAVRANNPATLNGSTTDGHHTCALIHLANISYRLGRSLRFDAAREDLVGDAEARAMLTKEYRAPYVVKV